MTTALRQHLHLKPADLEPLVGLSEATVPPSWSLRNHPPDHADLDAAMRLGLQVRKWLADQVVPLWP